MSAFIVPKADIDVLVAAGAQIAETNVDDATATRLGQALLNECVRSVSYRYSDDDLGELPGSYDEETIPGSSDTISIGQWLTPYAYRTPEQQITRDIVADAISSYEYQSCEHPEWETSWAFKYAQSLRAVLEQLPQRVLTPAPTPDPVKFARDYGDLSRDETIKRIRAALKRRSGKSWSVTGGRGTAYGWITISAPPKRRTGAHVQKPGAEFGEYEHVDTGQPQEFGLITPAECAELAELLGLSRPVHHQGETIPSSHDYYREYIDRAEGRDPSIHGTPYWD